jgi:hypothetical protein
VVNPRLGIVRMIRTCAPSAVSAPASWPVHDRCARSGPRWQPGRVPAARRRAPDWRCSRPRAADCRRRRSWTRVSHAVSSARSCYWRPATIAAFWGHFLSRPRARQINRQRLRRRGQADPLR